MKKILLLLIIICSCSTLKKDEFYLERNLNLVKLKYPNSKVEQNRYFSYIFNVMQKKDTFFVKVTKDKVIKKIE